MICNICDNANPVHRLIPLLLLNAASSFFTPTEVCLLSIIDDDVLIAICSVLVKEQENILGLLSWLCFVSPSCQLELFVGLMKGVSNWSIAEIGCLLGGFVGKHGFDEELKMYSS